MSDIEETPHVLRCASGEIHTEHGQPPFGMTYQCAAEAAEFMDGGDEDTRFRWTCGPHSPVAVSAVSL